MMVGAGTHPKEVQLLFILAQPHNATSQQPVAEGSLVLGHALHILLGLEAPHVQLRLVLC